MAQVNVNAPQGISSWGSKEYIIGFEDNGKIRTTRLNIFQRILRRIFGCYAETHLSQVLSLAKKNIFKTDWTFAEGDGHRVMQLFKKKVDHQGSMFPSYNAWYGNIEIDNKKVSFQLDYEESWDLFISGEENFCDGIDGITVHLKKGELPNTLEISGFSISTRLDTSEVDGKDYSILNQYMESLSLFLKHVLHHSPKLEKIRLNNHAKGSLSMLEKKRANSPANANLAQYSIVDDFVEEQTGEGKFWTISKDAAKAAEALEPLSFDFLLT